MTHGTATIDEPRSASEDPADQRLDTLISACAEGIESALEQLYKSTSSQLFGVLLRILGKEALAEQALQETYLEIWNNAEKYQSARSAPRTWLVSIARNHAIDVLRKRCSRGDIGLKLDIAALWKEPLNGHA